MTKDDIKNEAFAARALYKVGAIGRADALKMIKPYIEMVNAKAIELAKKYNLKAKKISFAGFVR